MLAIDRLIHEFHYSCKQNPDRPTRPAAVNLISGKIEQVATFLDDLGSLGLPGDLRQNRDQWRAKYEQTCWPQLFKKGRTDRDG